MRKRIEIEVYNDKILFINSYCQFTISQVKILNIYVQSYEGKSERTIKYKLDK